MRISILCPLLACQIMGSTVEKMDYEWRIDGMRNGGMQSERHHTREQGDDFVFISHEIHQNMFFLNPSIRTSLSSPATSSSVATSSSPSSSSSSPSSLPAITYVRPLSQESLSDSTITDSHVIPTILRINNRSVNISSNDSIVPEVDGLIFKQKDGSYVGAFQLDVDIQAQNQSDYSNQGVPKEASISSFGVIHLAAISLCTVGFLLGLLLTVFALKFRNNRLRWTRLEIV